MSFDLVGAIHRRIESSHAVSPDAPVATEPKRIKETEQFVPFPNHLLPGAFGEFAEAVASSIGCDPCFVAAPMVVAAAAAVGMSRTIQLKPGWEEPAILWACLVGESGDKKARRWTRS